jgi:putative peptide zinc metalloprotease protein
LDLDSLQPRESMIDNPLSTRSTMRLLRSDLIVTPTQNPPGCSVRDERSGEVYEFGAVENFLLSRLRRPYRTEDLSKECNDRFDLNYSSQDIEEFIEMLAGWELLQDGRRQSASPKDKIDIPHDVDEEIAAAAPPVGEESGPRRPGGWHLFNPEALLDGLNTLLGPLRFLVWLVPIAFVIGGLAVMFHWNVFLADVVSARAHFGILGRLALVALTISLADQIARGMVARHHGLSTPSFGVTLGLGLIPRFNIQIASADASDRKTRLWLYGVPTLVRIGLFGASTLMWSMNRASASFLATLGAELALLSAMVLLLGSNPLWRGDGSRFLSVLFDVPDIQERSRRALFGFFVKRPAVIERYSKNVHLLGLFGLVSMAFLLVVLGFLALMILRVFLSLEERFQGAGVALFVLAVVYIAFSIRRAIKARKRTPGAGESMQTTTSFTKAPRRGAAMVSPDRIGGDSKRGRDPRKWQRWLRYGLLLAFVIVLFLPYTYHPGGEAEVLPAAKATLPAEVDGVVDRVFFKGGEWIEAGTTLGKLADYQQVKDLRTTEASLESKKFENDCIPPPLRSRSNWAKLKSIRRS